MNWEQLFNYLKCNWETLSNHATLKLISGFAVIAASEILELHLQLLLLFCALIIVDLLTKWVAISHKRLTDKRADACLWSSILGIKAARKAGQIKSSEMKHRFMSKMIAYVLAVITAGLADIIMQSLHKSAMFVDLIVWYLAVTELLSIIENLNDAGVEAATKLTQIIKNKTGLGG